MRLCEIELCFMNYAYEGLRYIVIIDIDLGGYALYSFMSSTC